MLVSALEALASSWGGLMDRVRPSGGYRLPFESPPPLTRTPILFPAYRPGSPQSLALRQEIEKMMAKGALEIVPDPGPSFYSRLFLVGKATGGWRPVIDLSTLNTFIRQTPQWPCGVVLACLLHTQEVPGSIPGRGSYLRQVSLH